MTSVISTLNTSSNSSTTAACYFSYFWFYGSSYFQMKVCGSHFRLLAGWTLIISLLCPDISPEPFPRLVERWINYWPKPELHMSFLCLFHQSARQRKGLSIFRFILIVAWELRPTRNCIVMIIHDTPSIYTRHLIQLLVIIGHVVIRQTNYKHYRCFLKRCFLLRSQKTINSVEVTQKVQCYLNRYGNSDETMSRTNDENKYVEYNGMLSEVMH